MSQFQSKYVIPITISIIVIPVLILGRDKLIAIADTPDKVGSIEKKVEKHETALEQVSSLYLEQKARQDKDDAVTKAQLDAVKEQLKLIAEIRSKN